MQKFYKNEFVLKVQSIFTKIFAMGEQSKHFRAIYRAVFFSLVLLALPGWANTGQIGGKVLDARTLQPLVGVNIIIEDTQLGAATDADGLFLINNIPPGSYNLSFHYLGYQTLVKTNVVVNPAQRTVLEIHLNPEALKGEKVEVLADYFETPPGVVVSTRSVDMEEVMRDPGSALDIQRVMQAFPAVVSGSDQKNEIIVRGGMPGENLFLMDHIEIPNPNHFGDKGTGGGPINMINTLMVRKVDFYAGAFAARYGDKASSVMDISLREGNSERFSGKLEIGMAGAGVLAEGPINGGRGNFLLSARRSYLDMIIRSIGLTAVPHYYNLQGKVTYQINPHNKLLINGIFGADNIHIKNKGTTGGYSRGAENVKYAGSQYAVGATLQTFWSSRMYSYTTLSTVENDWDIQVYRTQNQQTYYTDQSTEREHTLKTDIYLQATPTLRLNWGASFKAVRFAHDIWSRQDTLFVYDRTGSDPDTVIGIYQIYPEYSVKHHDPSFKTAAYLQATVQLLSRLQATLGLRYDYFDFNRFHAFSPRAGLSYKLTPRLTFNLAYGKHYQSPAYSELTANPKNHYLKSKYNHQIVFGVEYFPREDTKMTLETYWKGYRDVPIFRRFTTPEPMDWYEQEMLNRGKLWAKGVELFFQKKLTRNWSGIVSYSYSIARALDLRNQTEYDWDYDYRHVFTIIGGYKKRLYPFRWYQNLKEQLWYKILLWLIPLGDEVELSFRFRYMGGRPYIPKVYHPELHRWLVEEQLKLNSQRYPAYHRLDFRLDRRFFFGSWNMVMYLDIMNIYNHHNLWEYQYNEDGTITNIWQYEVMPVLGVVLNF